MISDVVCLQGSSVFNAEQRAAEDGGAAGETQHVRLVDYLLMDEESSYCKRKRWVGIFSIFI